MQSKKMKLIQVGTPGLLLARQLYGMGSIVFIGSWLTPGEIEIPEEDVVAFRQLEQEFIQNN